MTRHIVVREYDNIPDMAKPALSGEELAQLREFALVNQTDKDGNSKPILRVDGNKIKAQNYVGVIETKQGTVIEILPKIDLGGGTGDEAGQKTKEIFWQMLRVWRRMKHHRERSVSHISALHRFSMLEVFIYLFLQNVQALLQKGLAKHYITHQDNLPCLRGRILFAQHIAHNMVNQARFFTEYDEFSADHPANRLLHSTLQKLSAAARAPKNRQLLYRLKPFFDEIPRSFNYHADFEKYQSNRAIAYYEEAMQWVRLFLFGQGLATYRGEHFNQCLLFPMEQIFEDYVANCLRRHPHQYQVKTQQQSEYLASRVVDGELKEKVFQLKPDIALKQQGNIKIIADTKWKQLNTGQHNNGISQSDLYQMFAYGKKYNCQKLALIYPKSENFTAPLHYCFDEKLHLHCIPFDLAAPKESVERIVKVMS